MMNTSVGKRHIVHVMLLFVWFAMRLFTEVAIAEQAHIRSDAFDVVHYDMTVYADPNAQKLSATVSINIQRSLATPSDSLDFLLDRQYKVTSVHRADGTPISFERVTDGEPISELHPGSADRYGWAFLRIPSSIFTSGDRQRIIVEYEGEKAIGMLADSKMFQMHSVGARWYPFRYDDPPGSLCLCGEKMFGSHEWDTFINQKKVL